MATFIFDLDGTLVDSFEQITAAANTVRVENGFPIANQEFSQSVIGLPAAELFADLDCSASRIVELVSMFRSRLLESICIGNTIFPGVIEFLTWCKVEGFSTAIATSKPQKLAEQVVLNSELNGMIDFIQGTDGFPPKPNPDVIHRVLKDFESPAIMFGDRPEDIQAGNNAGIQSIGIAQSIFTTTELASAGAKLTFQSFEELLEAHQSATDILNTTLEK